MEERNTSGDLLSQDLSISTWETNSISLNGSYYNYTTPCDVKDQAMILLSLIISAVGMVLNSIVLWFLGFRIHRNAFSVYILNLAVADLLFLCFQFVFCLLAIIYIFYSIYVDIPLFFYVVPMFAYLLGLSILSAISTERCLSVLWPIWYHCRRPRHTSAVTCIFFWALSLMLSLLKGNACGLLYNDFDFDFFWCYRFYVINTVWSIVLFVVLCGFSLILLIRIFCGSHRIPMTRLYVIIALTVLIFLIFGLPFGIYWLLYEGLKHLYYVKNCDFYHDTLFLSCVNSCANPIIYFLVGSIRHRRFQQKSLKLFLQRAMQDTPEEEEGGERGTSGNPEEVETV
ncbi:mas-related G-protein coupled receptor member B2-like [Psammomys obesus]|uniref:mas-related G-protein coupled receptor member B2-like n=1 Tax=Psammomys obesus TaxID=48139 RepID=UPI002452A20B|nr:mas-related G-protein coupled receptor member B2-like [Psammomys obesus]